MGGEGGPSITLPQDHLSLNSAWASILFFGSVMELARTEQIYEHAVQQWSLFLHFDQWSNARIIIQEKVNEPLAILCCFPHLKWNWKNDCLKPCLISRGTHKSYSTGLKKITSMVLLKHGKSYGIGLYIPKETISKEMAVEIEWVKATFLFLT